MPSDDAPDYRAMAERELGLAAEATDPAAKALHLNAAARYATLGERSTAPHDGSE